MDAFIDGMYGEDYNDILSKLMGGSPIGKLAYAEFSLPVDSWRQLPSTAVGKQVNAARLRSKIAQLSAVLKSERDIISKGSINSNLPDFPNENLPIFIDKELSSRCRDLFKAEDHFDRAVNQATLILESRIKSKFPELVGMSGLPLVSKAINPDPSIAKIVFSANGSEQEGFANLFKGIIGAYRNPTHHKIESIERRRSIQICGFIDNLLKALEDAEIVRDLDAKISTDAAND